MWGENAEITIEEISICESFYVRHIVLISRISGLFLNCVSTSQRTSKIAARKLEMRSNLELYQILSRQSGLARTSAPLILFLFACERLKTLAITNLNCEPAIFKPTDNWT